VGDRDWSGQSQTQNPHAVFAATAAGAAFAFGLAVATDARADVPRPPGCPLSVRARGQAAVRTRWKVGRERDRAASAAELSQLSWSGPSRSAENEVKVNISDNGAAGQLMRGDGVVLTDGGDYDGSLWTWVDLCVGVCVCLYVCVIRSANA